MEYLLTEETDAEALPAAVRLGISSADPPGVGVRDWVPLSLALRAEDGSLIGGLYGATMWGWLMVDGLWVAEHARGQGLGRRILLKAEAIAAERGCRGSQLGTFDFQARAFYERLGYRVIGEVEDFPAGHSHYQLSKRFA